MEKKLMLFIGVLIILVIIAPIIYSDEIKVREVKTIEKEEGSDYVPNEVLVKFKTGMLPSKVEEIFNEFNVTKISEIGKLGVHRLSITEGISVLEIINRFEKNPFVEFAEPNYYVYASFVPNDPFYSFQWHFDNPAFGGIHMESTWDVTTGSSSVIVAVLDTGVSYERFSDPNPAGCYNRFGQLKKCSGKEIKEYYQAPDLANTSFFIVAGSDLVNSDDHPNDDEAHGTHVIGTVAQSTNNNLGVAGVAFDTTIMPIKVLDAQGSGLSSKVAEGILLAVDNGAKIISMSLGSSSPSSVVESAVNYAYNNGVTVIAACGNDGSGSGCDYPAAFINVISVGATQYDETKAPYSNFGSNLDLVAPGGNTGVDQNNDGFADGVLQQTFESNADTSDFSYWFYQGTSMSTPHVAGVAALLLALDLTLTPSQIKNILISTAEDLGAAGRDDVFGWGLLDASAAVNSIASSGEFIDITLIGYPLEFGNLDYGTTDSSASGNDLDQYRVRVESSTTVNVDIFKKGDDFTNNGNSIAVNNVTYDDDNDILVSDNEAILTNNYPTSAYFSNVTPNTEKNLYYWISVPSGQEAGTYTSTIFIKAVETGMSP